MAGVGEDEDAEASRSFDDEPRAGAVRAKVGIMSALTQELRRRTTQAGATALGLLARVPGARPAGEILVALGRELQRDRVAGLAAEVAFFALLGIFPLLLALTAALGSLEVLIGDEAAMRAQDVVVEVLQRNLTDQGAEVVASVEQLFAEGSPGLLTLGLLAALWAGSRGFLGLIHALDTAYKVVERRSYVALRATALLLSLGSVLVAALGLLVMVVGPLLGAGHDVANAIGAGEAFARAWDLARQPVAFAGVVAWVATVFHVGPNHSTPWRWEIPGAVVTAVLWLAIFAGFRVYLAVAAGGNLILGALGGMLVLALWLYALSISMLLGAELNAVLVRRAGAASQPAGVPRPESST